jgi:hypothetical protein
MTEEQLTEQQADADPFEIGEAPFTFKDKNGKEWDATLTLGGARRIDQSDFSALTDKKFSILVPEKGVFMEVLTNSSLVFAMIWAINQDRVQENLGIDPAENPEEAELAFLDSLDGSAITAGRRAFWGALSAFFPAHKTALLTLIQQLAKTEAKIGLEIRALIPDLERVMNKEIKNEVAKARDALTKVGGKSSG